MPIDRKPRKLPSQERSSVTVDAILTAATRILLGDGYAALKTTEVARVAGVSVGSLYQYFPNKQAIVAAIIARHMQQIRLTLLSAPTESVPTLAGRVRVMITCFLAVKRDKLALSQALAPGMAEVAARDIVMAEVRLLVDDLAAKLGLTTANGVRAETRMDLRTATGAIEGIVTELIVTAPEALLDPEFEGRLSGIFLAALGAETVATIDADTRA
jgi:AcrR family transcriptional regulator